MRSHSVDMSTLLNQPVKMTPLSKTTGKFYSGRLTSVKRKQLGRNWHLLCFPGDYRVARVLDMQFNSVFTPSKPVAPIVK